MSIQRELNISFEDYKKTENVSELLKKLVRNYMPNVEQQDKTMNKISELYFTTVFKQNKERNN